MGDADELRVKESDRIGGHRAASSAGMGARIDERADGMVIEEERGFAAPWWTAAGTIAWPWRSPWPA